MFLKSSQQLYYEHKFALWRVENYYFKWQIKAKATGTYFWPNQIKKKKN